jgi:hypothetical protein
MSWTSSAPPGARWLFDASVKIYKTFDDIDSLLKALLEIVSPICNRPSHESAENEVEFKVKRPRLSDVHHLKFHIGWNATIVVSIWLARGAN